ncbi:putative multidrug resistance protein [Hibiscus syriacus]|uniref:Multidrug resistance protein n=1 Tax=Hibiscus syriacus TaxID=106335 RepID=A0A6A2WXK6_HIBSY|nr:putative multidrug resistance protein [Hibiscus syriacus]
MSSNDDFKKEKHGSISSIFMHADGVDMWLMVAGFIGAVADGSATPLMIYLVGHMFNSVGSAGSASSIDLLTHNVNKNTYNISDPSYLFPWLTGCSIYDFDCLWWMCWVFPKTSERQAARMRTRYLKAVLRQNVGYFDMNETSTAEVVTSVSNESLIIQDVISEKVPSLITTGATFIGCCIIPFLIAWKLALVIRVEYNKANTIAEQAISSVRTVYAFVGENTTTTTFSAALQGALKLGLRQGLANGVAVGSNGITFAVRAFIIYYGSRMVIYHGAKGGTIFIVCSCITLGGKELGIGLSKLKPLYEACAAAERINEMIEIVPKIDLDNLVGETLDKIVGEFEFKQVEFAYPSRPESIIFKSFCLKIPAGKTVALVGSSGSGKTTLKWLRSQMGLVSQEPTLFATTIKENILFGNEEAGMEQVTEAAKASNAHNFISQFPQGYDTQVMEIGAHDELMVNGKGFYSMLVQLQQTEQLKVVEESSNHASLDGEMKVSTPSVRRLSTLNLPEWKQATIGCLSAILVGAVQPLSSFTMGSMISMFFLTDHSEIKEKAKVYALAFLGFFLFSLAFNIILHYNFSYTGEHLTKRMRERLLSKILTFEIGWFEQDENSSGPVCSRLEKDASGVRSLFGDGLPFLVQTFSCVTLAFAMGLFIAWRLAIVMILVQPLIILSIYARMVLLKRMSQKAIEAQQESSKLATEAVSNHRTITAFSSQDRILKMLHKSQESPRKENVRQSWLAGLALGLSQFLLSSVIAFDFWYGSKLKSQGHISSKAFIETYLILINTGFYIAKVANMTSDLAKSVEVVGSLFAISDRCTKIEPDDSNGYVAEEITGHVEICDIDFAYPARPNMIVLKNFSISIEAGKSTALVGQSGSGKSTVVSLIERFYDPLKGVVKIDGRDIRLYNLRSLRKHIALVSQEPALFSRTIKENILYGASDKTNESEIIEAAKAANAHDFISGLSNGYDTWCGDRGVQLSGGQKQRISIARAILRNSMMLLLDEATSALDGKSEKLVQEALERMMVGRTSVVVAHKLSTIQNCDVIFVLDKGKVIENGNHSSLLAKGPTGAYYSLVNLQSRTHDSTWFK